MPTILVVDDDDHIREVLRFALARAGHHVVEAADGVDAWRAFQSHPVDLVVLDIILPGEDGLDLCRRLRRESDVPILFLSSRDEELDRVLGLELGADDYITKPFSPRELVARIKAVFRRVKPSECAGSSCLRLGPLSLDEERHRARWRDAALPFTPTEFSILRILMSRPGRVYSRRQLIAMAVGDDYVITDRTVDTHIRRLRKKLKAAGARDDLIETVYGIGYRVREQVE